MSLILFAIFIFLVASATTYLANGLLDWLLKSFLFTVAFVIPSGYILSSLDLINATYSFLGLLVLLALGFRLLVHFYIKNNPINLGVRANQELQKMVSFWRSANTYIKLVLTILGGTLLFVTGINILVLFITYPNEWDSMTSHLVKSAFYLQNGNMDRLQGTTWAIDFYPNSLPTLQIAGYHVFGEKGFKLIHYVSYWIFVLSSAGITGFIFTSKQSKYFVFIIAALLPSALIQAVTTEADIIQSAYLGLVVYFLISIHNKYSQDKLYYFVLAACIWISHKVTFLLISPALFVVFAYVLWSIREKWKSFVPAFVLFVLGLIIYVLPNGYYANVKEVGKFSLGALSAPPLVMKWHGIENYSTSDKIRNFKLNAFRYTSDFLHLDGIRNTKFGEKVNNTFRIIPNLFFSKFDLERDEFWVVNPFLLKSNSRFEYYKERPFWGVIGIFLIPLALLLLVIKRKQIDKMNLIIIFLAAFTIHFLSLCYSAPYDPIKGRYFLNASIWLLPLLGIIEFKKWSSIFLIPISILIAWTAIHTLSFRKLYPLQGTKSIFKLDRVEQLTISRPELTDAYKNFDKLVPADAIVALGTQQEQEDFEYPLWGADFKRKLIPIHPFRSELKPIPEEAEYLIYAEGVFEFQSGDVQLGSGNKTNDTPLPESTLFLRKLNKD